MNLQEIAKTLDLVQYKDWQFHIYKKGDRFYLQIAFQDICNDTGKEAIQKGRKWLLSEHMTQSEIVQTAFKAIISAEEHETREKFLYKNYAVFGPHFDVDQLADLCSQNALDVRKNGGGGLEPNLFKTENNL